MSSARNLFSLATCILLLALPLAASAQTVPEEDEPPQVCTRGKELPTQCATGEFAWEYNAKTCPGQIPKALYDCLPVPAPSEPAPQLPEVVLHCETFYGLSHCEAYPKNGRYNLYEWSARFPVLVWVYEVNGSQADAECARTYGGGTVKLTIRHSKSGAVIGTDEDYVPCSPY